MPISLSQTLASLPPPWPEPLLPRIRQHLGRRPGKVVVLDDDPTGTQTVHGIPVLTEWTPAALRAELLAGGPGFYLLTNTRAFSKGVACRINHEVGRLLRAEAEQAGVACSVISRSDSTLRGHFPDEVVALGRGLRGGSSVSDSSGIPPILICPYFEEGGRYTIGNIHYVAEGDCLVPAAETPFARDSAFGYRSSDLRLWVEEKTGGRVRADEVICLSLETIRQEGPSALVDRLILNEQQVAVANAACPRDLEVMVLAGLMAEERGARTIYRTAASFVAVRLGLEPKPLLTSTELLGPAADLPSEPVGSQSPVSKGGLIVVGSHVPKTTEQFSRLIENMEIERIELPVESLLRGPSRDGVVQEAAQRIHEAQRQGRHVALFTSRKLIEAESAEGCLTLGEKVMTVLVEIVQKLAMRPRFLVAKGGITSSDVATKALGVRRALVLGQILPGIPVWRLGAETKFPGMSYVVFPGNVGRPDALLEVCRRLSL